MLLPSPDRCSLPRIPTLCTDGETAVGRRLAGMAFCMCRFVPSASNRIDLGSPLLSLSSSLLAVDELLARESAHVGGSVAR